jgi:hypothetical protein
MLNKLLNFGKKSNGYYLELDENKESTNGKVAAVTKAVEQKLASAKEVVEDTAQSVKEVVEDKVAATKEVVEEKTESVKKAATTKTKSKATKKGTKNNNKETKVEAVKTNTANSGASSWEQPFWVKAMYQNNSNGNGKANNAEATFATDYLLTNGNTSRRRPGPSLNKFKAMANKAKTN